MIDEVNFSISLLCADKLNCADRRLIVAMNGEIKHRGWNHLAIKDESANSMMEGWP